MFSFLNFGDCQCYAYAGGDYFGFFKEFLIWKFRYIKDNTVPVPYRNFGLTFWTCSWELAFKMTKVCLKHLIFFQNGTTLSFCKPPNFAGLKKLLNTTMQIEDLLTFWQAEDISWVIDCLVWGGGHTYSHPLLSMQ